MTKIDIISGFLGAGKTTFIKKLLEEAISGEQVVLISEKSFEKIDFLGYDVADYRKYYYKRAKRDEDARKAYFNKKKNLEQLKDDIFILDIIRGDMKNDDPRLQSVISE